MYTHTSERPQEDSILLFKIPYANSRNEPLALVRVMKVSKQPNSSVEEYTVRYYIKITLSKHDALPIMEQVVINRALRPIIPQSKPSADHVHTGQTDLSTNTPKSIPVVRNKNNDSKKITTNNRRWKM